MKSKPTASRVSATLVAGGVASAARSNQQFPVNPVLTTIPRHLLAGLALGAGFALGAFFPQGASAGILAEDHFLIGDDPEAGEYWAPTSRGGGQEGSPGGGDIGLEFQYAVVPGFETTEWRGNRGEVNPFGMSYPGLESSGGMAHSNPADHGQRFGRAFDVPFTHQTSGTYYLSFLMMLNQNGGDWGYRAMELHDGGFDDGAHRKFQLGVHRSESGGQGDFGPGDGGWGVRVNGDNNLRFQFPNQNRAQNEAHLFVIRFDMSTTPGGDSVTIWLNPPANIFGGGEEPEGGETLSGFDLTIDRISFASWQTPFWFNPYLGAVFFDEIRLGTSWAAVTPAGEPSRQVGEFLEYSFGGSLEGWDQLTVENTNWGPQRWIGVAAMDARQVAGEIPLNPSAAKQYLHVDARFPGGADLAHPTLWMRSPEFRLNGAGDLSFWIMGGGENPNLNAVVPTSESQVPAMSMDTTDGGFHGVVLRNAETGDFVMVGNRTTNDFDWQQVTFTAAELAALDQQALYTLDAIDFRHNSWSWFNFDSVSIPGFIGPPPPTSIGPILDQIIVSGTSSGPIPFTLYDDHLDPAGLTVTAYSSDPTLVPSGNIVIAGSGADRTVTVAPSPGQIGSATITLIVIDGTESATRVFKVTVPPPTDISDFPDQQIQINTHAGPLAFRLHDDVILPSALTVTATSSNTTLVPNANIVFWGDGADRTVRVKSAADRFGTTTITLTVTGGTQPASTSLVVNVQAPTIHFPFLGGTTVATYGWTTVSADPVRFFEVQEGGGQGATASGHVGMASQNDNQHVTAWVRSPEFRLSGAGAGPLTVWLRGGEDNGPRFTNQSQVPANSQSNGFMGVVLRNAQTGAFVWSGVKASGGNNWEQVILSEAALLLLNQNAIYTLDFIDARHGGWGHGRMDNVMIPGTRVNPPPVVVPPLAIERSGADQVRLSWPATAAGWILQTSSDVVGPYSDSGLAVTVEEDDIAAYDSTLGKARQFYRLISGSIPPDGNSAPTISAIADQSITMGSTTGALAFTIGDAQTAAGSLTVSGASSNTTLVPTANIVFGGSGANRIVTVTPATGQSGFATITVTVSDGDLTASDSFLLSVTSGAGPITFGFDNNTLQGWSLVSTDNQGRQFFALVPPSVSSPNTTPQAGTHFIGLHIPAFSLTAPAYTQDGAHDTLLLRSPGFTLNGAGDLTAWLSGGGTGSPNLAGTSVGALSATSANGGFRGIALRNVTTGQFVLSRSKTSDGNGWQQVTMTAAQLAALPQDHVYTLDFIDAAHGGWGWVNMDSVSIPGQLVPSQIDVAPPTVAYGDWAAAKGLSGPDAAFDADPDSDGMSNGIEFVLGGEPNPSHTHWNSLALLPTAEAQGNSLVFTYTRTKSSAYLAPFVEFNSTLSGLWTVAQHGVNASISEVDGGTFETVTVTIPKNGAPTLFARLRVVHTAP